MSRLPEMPLPGGTSDLSAKRTYENLNTLGVWGLASLRSFLQKTNKTIQGLSIEDARTIIPMFKMN